MKILNHFATETKDSTEQSLGSWPEFALRFWKFTDEFQGLIKYKDLEQKKKDKKLQAKVDELFNKYFQEESQHYNDTMKNLLT